MKPIDRAFGVSGALTGSVLLLGADQAHAAAFFLQEQSVRGVGRANAGSSAIADDASTIFFNPAGMPELAGPESALGLYVIFPQAEFENRGSTVSTPGTLGALVPLTGGDGGNPYDQTFVPNAYAAFPLVGDKLWLGLGVTAPFGIANEYDEGWFGRYDSTESELTTIDIAPTIAYAVNNFFSVGAGLDIQYADATLENALPNPLTPGGPTAATDGRFKAEGDDWSIGFNVGLLIKPLPSTRIGLHYRSAIEHDLEGNATFSGLTGSLAPFNRTSGVSAELNLPEVVSLGVAYDVTPRLTLLGQVNWFGWDNFDEIRIRFADDPRDQIRPQNYDDSWSAAIGAEYKLTDAWTLRGGVQYDETPTVDGFRNTTVPDSDRYWTAIGASYNLSDRFAFDVAYAHVFMEDADVDLSSTFFASTPAASTVDLNAVSENSIDIVSAQVRLRF